MTEVSGGGNRPKRRDASRELAPRRKPLQQRSVERAQQIIDVAAELLEEVGFDDLTTIRIAEKSGISVGTLYHYFPNKHAILYAMGERWLGEVEAALDRLSYVPLIRLPPSEFVDLLIEGQLAVYRSQLGKLPLVQAMFSVPELRELDQRHGDLVIDRMAGMLEQYGMAGTRHELERIAGVYLELTHALLLLVVNQRGQRAQRTLSDLKHLTKCLIEGYL